MPDVALTLDALLASARAQLTAAGIDDAVDEALRLWSGLWRVAAPEAYLARREPVTHEAAGRFEDAVARRAAGEPLAYIIGWTGFRRLELATDRRALIPRPETEGVIDLLLRRQATGTVADIGTGSGCLALALADEADFATVHAADSSTDALALAALNAATLGLPIRFHHGDLVAPLAGLGLDAVVSNPPYLTDAEYAALDPSVKAWEPAGALVSGADGLAHTRRLLDEARAVVRSGGWLVMEIDSQRGSASAASARHFGWAAVEVHQDLFGRDRYLTARRSEA
ncbi:MAG: peptide chain release factor N(5)-glutamine methyltransferase [Gemmatimonadales bacterium]